MDKNNVRKFFDTFAEKRGFDPLIPENWYKYQNSDIENEMVIPFFII